MAFCTKGNQFYLGLFDFGDVQGDCVYRSAMCENRSMDESADETISHGGMDVRPVTPSQGEANALLCMT